MPLDRQFLEQFKRETEARWSTAKTDPQLYGFQFQPGTRWNRGLSEAQILAYEHALKLRFPDDFRRMLSIINGTDRPTLNMYGNSGEPYREGIGAYAYPRDLAAVQSSIDALRRNWQAVVESLTYEGFLLMPDTGLVPLFGHRFLVCGSNPAESTVLSICGGDAIVYANSLQVYLEKAFLVG